MLIQTDGLVIMERNVGEADRLVTLLTRKEGVFNAFARQAKRIKSIQASSTSLLCYSHFSIYKGKDIYIINDAQPINIFFDLRSNIEKLALSQYFCELVRKLAPQEKVAEDFLRLILNALYFLSRDLRSKSLLKAVVEMRMLSLAGFMPDLVCCFDCSCYESEQMYFVLEEGNLCCANCYQACGQKVFPLRRGGLTALRHSIYADFDKLFSFQVSGKSEKELAETAETCVLYVLGHSLQTLQFYKSLANS